MPACTVHSQAFYIVCCSILVHVPAPYSKVDATTALKTLALVSFWIACWFHKCTVNLKNTPRARQIHVLNSSVISFSGVMMLSFSSIVLDFKCVDIVMVRCTLVCWCCSQVHNHSTSSLHLWHGSSCHQL